MHDELLRLLAPRSGHFQFESGLHGDVWLDLERLFSDRRALCPFVVELAARLATHQIDMVCGPQTGGALLGQMISTELDVEFHVAERISGPPVEYRIPTDARSGIRDKRVAVVDDAMYAASAVRRTAAALEACGAIVVAIGALLVLGDSATRLAEEQRRPLERITHIKAELWEAVNCPLCRANLPLDVT